MEEEYFTILEFAKYMKVHHNTVRKAIKVGHLQAINIGSGKNKIYRIPKSEIQRLGVFQLKTLIKSLNEEGLKC